MRKNIAITLLTLVVSLLAFAMDQPTAGTKAPAFNLQSQDGSSVSLEQLHGKWIVLYFYPKDLSQGCTIEAHNFQRDKEKYEQKNAIILGVSMDNMDSHKEFCAKEGLNFKLLADTDQKTSEKYGSVMDYQGKKYSARNTFLIDPEGVIKKVYIKVNPSKHSEEVLADLQQLQGK